MSEKNQTVVSNQELMLLKGLVVFLFLGRAIQGLFFDLHFRTFFWDQNLLEGLILSLGWQDWKSYATSLSVDRFINGLSTFFGIIWLLCALGTIQVKTYSSKFLIGLLYIGCFFLGVEVVLSWKDKYYFMAQLLEHAIQLTTPLLLIRLLRNELYDSRLAYLLKVIVALTFVCHGLFAYGYYPLPGDWVTWCNNSFPFTEDAQSIYFLKLMGIIDFVAAAFILIPQRLFFSMGIYYCIVWGFLTALARVWANFTIDFPLDSMAQWTHQTLFRLVHGGLPLLLLLWENRRSSAKK